MVDWINLAASGLLAALAVSDLRARRLPNSMIAALAALYVVHALVAGQADAFAPSTHLMAAAIAFAVAALLCFVGWIAGGDAKLAAAVFLWAGPGHALPVFVIVSICGLVVALCALGAGAAMRLDARAAHWTAWLAPARGVPYGVALASGGAVAVWWPPGWPPAHAPASSAHKLVDRAFDAVDAGSFLALVHGFERDAVRLAVIPLARHLGLA